MIIIKRVIIVATILILVTGAFGYGGEASPDWDVFKQGMDAEGQLRIYEARERYATAPQNSGFLTHYAWFLTRFDFPEEAITVFNRLLSAANGNPHDSIYLGLAWNHQKIGQLDTALAYYKKKISLSAANRQQAIEDVRWYLHEENRRKIESLKQKITSGNEPLKHRRELAEVYLDQGELHNVIRLAGVLRSQENLDLRTHLYLAWAYLWSGDLHQAETTFAELDKRSPESAFLYTEWAKVHMAQDRMTEAQALLEKALNHYHGATTARRLLAEILAEQHQGKAALAMADTISPDDANRLNALMARARSRHFSGQVESAQPIYARVLKDYPFYPDALWGMTETSIATGRYGDADKALQSWKQVPADPRREIQQQRFRLYTAPTTIANAAYYTNSSNFSRTDAGLSAGWYLGNEWRLTTGYRFSVFFQQDFSEIYRNSGFLDIQKGLTDHLQFTGGLTGHFYNSEHRSLNGLARLSYQFTPEISIHPWFRHMEVIDTTQSFENMTYSHTVSIGAVALNLTADEIGGRIDYRPHPRLAFSGDLRHAEYSDDNHSWKINGEASYRIALKPDWRIAYNYFFLDNRDPAPIFHESGESESAYYDPINFETHSLRLKFRAHGDGNRLTYGAEGALSYIPKCDGTGIYLSAFVSLDLAKDLLLRLNARGFYQNRGTERFGTTGDFWANNLLLTFEYRF